MGVLPQVDGSALFELGNTRVLATVHGPREPRQKGQAQHDCVALTARFHAATFSSVTGERRRILRQDRRLTEWGHYIEELYSSAIIGSLFPRSQIEIFIEVLNADGSVLAAAINATTLALVNAGIPVYDYVVATSVGHLAQTALLDINRMEEGGGRGNPSLTVAAYGRNPNLTLLVTGDTRVGADKLESMSEVARSGMKKLFDILDETVVRPNMETMLESRKSNFTEQ
ncbi:hypothetical protein PSACC_01834 [Paramicrosporidium saccamoebae]|uniref:Exoribonuclease phosphorolytic domain-containing protein n=1 Tax=Paramicrosporidium saccamoebae TaxID=1246581 RepID=A0A2H9TKR2_9FUNG|nr:hypothetical protein PSACC_01834 [Paramicrosporidium saccamoebae]